LESRAAGRPRDEVERPR
jgi:hypothetical protein